MNENILAIQDRSENATEMKSAQFVKPLVVQGNDRMALTLSFWQTQHFAMRNSMKIFLLLEQTPATVDLCSRSGT